VAVELRVVLVRMAVQVVVAVAELPLVVMETPHQSVHPKVITAVQVLRFPAQIPAAVVVDGAR
jgi:hypothetical protein